MKDEGLKDKELWMGKLKEKLENYSEPIPVSHWEQLEKELMPPAVTKRMRVSYRRWGMAIAASLLVAISSVSLYFLNTPVADEVRRTNISRFVSGPDLLPQSGEVEDRSVAIREADPICNTIAQAKKVVELEGTVPLKPSVNDTSEMDSHEAIKENEVTTVSEEQLSQKQKKEERKEQQAVRQVRKPSRSDKLHIPSGAVSKEGKWAMGAALGNAGGRSGSFVNEGAMGGFSQRLNMASTSDALIKVPENQTVYFENGLPYLQNKSEVIDIKHHQPISVGFTVRKGLKKGFSIETGLTYTLLSSDVTMSGSDASINQKLHYIGIPVRANWNFLEKNRFTMYVSAGGQIEKCVYGKRENEKLLVRPLQLSVLGAIGAQFNATKRLGIYVEPGVAYFFDDGSDVKTIRKENPFNFNMQAGVRFTY